MVIHKFYWFLVHYVCLKIHQVCWVWVQVHTQTVCQAHYLRQVVEVLHSASRSDSDPIDLVVQAIQEETQELLSILLAAKHTVSWKQKHQPLDLWSSQIISQAKAKFSDVTRCTSVSKTQSQESNKAYLYPTNLGAYLWIWVLNSDGLTASLLHDVHMVCISLANSTNTETLMLLTCDIKHTFLSMATFSCNPKCLQKHSHFLCRLKKISLVFLFS